MINSSLVSAQNRQRLYWTNIGLEPQGLFGDLESTIQQPKDKVILLKDILEADVDAKYYLSEKMIAGFERHKERHSEKGTGFGFSPKNGDDKGNCLRANAALAPTDNMIITHNLQKRSADRPSLKENKNAGGSGHLSKSDGKTYCLDIGNTQAIEYKSNIRRLTPVECERLQTVKDNYTNHVSDSQRYKMLGNGWTVDVIAHILNYIK